MMHFKIDTKEKFKEINLLESEIPAIMTGDLAKMLNDALKTDPRNVILSLKGVETMCEEAGEVLTGIQTRYYDEGVSFVICEMHKNLEETLEETGILETMNVAPTLSEAWDIVQMEEIERELLSDWE
jgi:anti-anti-sigma factor